MIITHTTSTTTINIPEHVEVVVYKPTDLFRAPLNRKHVVRLRKIDIRGPLRRIHAVKAARRVEMVIEDGDDYRW